MRAPRRNSLPSGLTDKSEETVIVGKEQLTISKRVAVPPPARQGPESPYFCRRSMLTSGQLADRDRDLREYVEVGAEPAPLPQFNNHGRLALGGLCRPPALSQPPRKNRPAGCATDPAGVFAAGPTLPAIAARLADLPRTTLNRRVCASRASVRRAHRAQPAPVRSNPVALLSRLA